MNRWRMLARVGVIGFVVSALCSLIDAPMWMGIVLGATVGFGFSEMQR